MAQIRTRGQILDVPDNFADLSAREQDDYIDEKLGPSTFTNVLRSAIGQGLALGFGDEVEAFVRSLGSDRKYSELVKEVRGDIDRFREESPVLAYGSELLGGALTGGAGVGRTVGSTALRSAAVGAGYGAGQADGDIQDRLQGAALGSVLSGSMGAAAKKILPGVSAQARQLQKEGVELTPGMALEGTIGKGVKELEETLTSLPLLGTGPAFTRTKESFTKSIINKALNDIDETLPNNLSIDDATLFLTNKVGKALDNSIESLKIKDAQKLTSQMESLLRREGAFSPSEIKNIKNSLFKTTFSKASDNQLTGKSLQNADEVLRKKINRFGSSTDAVQREQGDAYRKLYKLFEDTLKKDNTASDVSKYLQAKKAYAKEQVIRKASTASTKDATFTPGQLLQASKSADKSAQKGLTFQGKGLLQPEGRVAQDVIGRSVGDSGTAGRLLGTGLLLGGASFVNPAVGIAAGLGASAYRNPLTQRALLEALGQGQQLGRLAPILGGYTANRD